MRASEFDQAPAAGCILYAEDTGRWGLQQRSNSVTDPGVWSTWGGGREPGETVEQCVLRELAEESGYHGPTALTSLGRNRRYHTFVAKVPKEFTPKLNSESQDWCWVDANQWPQPLHPDLAALLGKINENFADGKIKGRSRPGRVKRSGASCKGSVTDLRSKASKYGGERGRMYHWCANMKSGRQR